MSDIKEVITIEKVTKSVIDELNALGQESTGRFFWHFVRWVEERFAE